MIFIGIFIGVVCLACGAILKDKWQVIVKKKKKPIKAFFAALIKKKKNLFKILVKLN